MSKPRSPALDSRSTPVRYEVRVADAAAHRFAVQLTLARPQPRQRFALPVWIPGSYLVREFARHLLPIEATQGGQALAVRQLDKCSWEVDCDPRRPLVLRYGAYAFDPSVRTAWLDARRGFFNGTSLLLCAQGHEAEAHALSLPAPRGLPAWPA